MDEYEVAACDMNIVLTHELALLEAIKIIVKLANGDAPTIIREIDNLKAALRK